tara:strand:- start:390 stop:596 length:207 start_codon:yes stop_codon:yes gene_type:complete
MKMLTKLKTGDLLALHHQDVQTPQLLIFLDSVDDTYRFHRIDTNSEEQMPLSQLEALGNLGFIIEKIG